MVLDLMRSNKLNLIIVFMCSSYLILFTIRSMASFFVPQETEQQKTEREARQYQEMIRDTDQYLANQQQSEPMDIIDPDG